MKLFPVKKKCLPPANDYEINRYGEDKYAIKLIE